ncbi:MAG: hypothetical protein ACRDTA_27325 [Pseudonocardiaceae bacterium]
MEYMLIILCVLIFTIFLVTMVIRRHVRATVASFAWSRSVDMQEETWVTKTSSWGSPANSRNQRSKQERHWHGYTTYEGRLTGSGATLQALDPDLGMDELP